MIQSNVTNHQGNAKQKSMMRYHAMPAKMAIKKKMKNTWLGNWTSLEEKLVGMQNGTPAMGNSMKVPQKIKIELLLSSPTSGYLSMSWNDIRIYISTYILIHNSTWNSTKWHHSKFNGWIEKKLVAYTYNIYYYPTLKKKKLLPHVTNMDEPLKILC